ncbi:MAG: PqqD family protein [Wenzhouxiangella sp.]
MDDLNHKLIALKRSISEGRLSLNLLDDGSGVLLDGAKEELLTLNRTAAFIVGQLESADPSADDLVRALYREFAVEEDRARNDVHQLIEELWQGL